MLYGTITSVGSLGSTKGEITEDETLTVYAFDDPELGTKGLGIRSAVTFESLPGSKIPTAINIQPYSTREITINKTVSGPLTVQNGDTVIVESKGNVKGDITILAGNLIVGKSGKVTGNVSSDSGSIVLRSGGVIKGNISINQNSALKVGGKTGGVKGNVTVNEGGRIIMGDSEGGGVIKGSIESNFGMLSMRPDSIVNTNVGD